MQNTNNIFSNLTAVLAFMLLKATLIAHRDLDNSIWFFSGHLEARGKHLAPNLGITEFFSIESYDILVANKINFYTVLAAVVLCLGLVLFLLAQANLLNVSFYPNATFDSEKYSPYECGFTPFWTERAQFDIKFYLVALLFLVFDVELMFLLPYSMSYNYLGLLGYIVFIIFFTLLVLGFLVEWSVGMLVWKDEENSPQNIYKLTKAEIDYKKSMSDYFTYIKIYLRIFDQKAFEKLFVKIVKVPWSYKVRKFTFRRPYHFHYYSQEPLDFFPRTTLDFIDFDNALVLSRTWLPFQGAATTSITSELLQIEKKKKQERIERFFTTVYGEWYTTWLNKLSPEDRDFTLE